MSKSNVVMSCLLATSASGALLANSGVAFAQQNDKGQVVQEVVVTATRREDTVHNIPLAITAVSNRDLDVRGFKNGEDIAQLVSGLQISSENTGPNGNFQGQTVAIRGITSSNNTGAATTGIYIDDVPLQQRTFGGSGGGFAFPNLFDLQRVEVLKGPQGTLYGGSSEGGTVRFITPQVSLTKTSLYAKGELNTTEHGKQGYDLGVSVGAPIVQDKLGVRLTASFRHDGGYVDQLSRFTGKTIEADTNWGEHVALHASVAWKPTDRSTVTLSYLYQREAFGDVSNFWGDIPQYTSVTAFGPHTYGPYKFGPYTAGMVTQIGDNFYTSDSQLSARKSPSHQTMSLPSITLDYAFDKMNVKSVTSLNRTVNLSHPYFGYLDVARFNSIVSTAALPTALPDSPFVNTMPDFFSAADARSKYTTLTQEVRFSSNNPASRLTWTAGIYYYHTQASVDFINTNQNNSLVRYIVGAPVPILPPVVGVAIDSLSSSNQVAAYGEATYKITEKLRVTAGIRATRDSFTYTAFQGGPTFGLPYGTFLASGTATSSPVTPKFGLQYVFDTNTNVYVNAAKGFRPGGPNQQPAPQCQQQLVQAGYPNGAPTTYGPDSLWSYEAGAKVRAFGGRAAFESSVFRIDWTNVQTQIGLACGNNFIVSLPNARSQGADFQGSFILFPGFTVSANVAYTDAKYTTDVFSAPGIKVVAAGNPIPATPKWTYNLSGEYAFEVAGQRAFIRADWAHKGSLFQNLGPGTASAAPDAYLLGPTNLVNARIGLSLKQVEVQAYVNNLTASTDLTARGSFAASPGRNVCLNTACTSFARNQIGEIDSTFRPRTWGVSMSYRY